MKHLLFISLLILWLSAGAWAQKPADNSADLSAQVQRLEAEVRTLRVALLRVQLTLQKAQVAQLENELQTLQREQQKAEQREADRNKQLQQLTDALASTQMDADTRAEAEGLRASLLHPVPAHKREALDRRARAVAAQLEREQQHGHRLRQQARALGLEISSEQD